MCWICNPGQKLKPKFLWKSLTGHICPSDIAPGIICPFFRPQNVFGQKMVWNKFFFTQNYSGLRMCYALNFFNLENKLCIKLWLDQNISVPIFFGSHIFLGSKFFYQIFELSNFVDPKIFWAQYLFAYKIRPKNLFDQHFLNPIFSTSGRRSSRSAFQSVSVRKVDWHRR